MGFLKRLFGKASNADAGSDLPKIESAIERLVSVPRSGPLYMAALAETSAEVAKYGRKAIPVIIAAADKYPEGRDRLAGTLGAICKMHRRAVGDIRSILGQGCTEGARTVLERALTEAGK